MLRGIRGAISVEKNTREKILKATEELLVEIRSQNGLELEDIASAIFTVTDDLNAEFPASAARKLGWTRVPLLCSREIPVPGSMQRVIRVLLQVNTDKDQNQIRHVYLGEASRLRDDL
ncbi:MAG: chorismate mutase [Candidatus Margulisiibacteriota bacterium]|jgi:chorismate mutase